MTSSDRDNSDEYELHVPRCLSVVMAAESPRERTYLEPESTSSEQEVRVNKGGMATSIDGGWRRCRCASVNRELLSRG